MKTLPKRNAGALRAAAVAAALVLAPAAARAAVLTSVPMQGSMVMPTLSYSASDGALHAQVDPTVPQLIPLLASNPADQFAPADPWFGFLDPSRQGLAFSRRYGFTMSDQSDFLPDGTAIWLRKLSGSPEIGLYNYRSTAPKAWTPIFGTAGSTNALFWNGMMFHPGVTAPPGTNSYSATFDAFLVNTNTGAVVPGSGCSPFTLNWAAVTDGRPALDIGPGVVIAWPASATNWVLECAPAMTSTNWALVTNAPVIVNGRPAVLLNPCGDCNFFRMRKAQ